MTWNHNEDPTNVYGVECTMCGRWFADNEDLIDGLCDDCFQEMEDDTDDQ